eukprot:scaffold207794_cov19-Tisochrysis_lutea.AAC.1
MRTGRCFVRVFADARDCMSMSWQRVKGLRASMHAGWQGVKGPFGWQGLDWVWACRAKSVRVSQGRRFVQEGRGACAQAAIRFPTRKCACGKKVALPADRRNEQDLP